jgi:hypothetical protein
MPALTRRRSPDAREECWHIYYGDVHAGTIAIRTGVPHDEDPWGWSCGFYPGSHPGECTNGSAPTFDQAAPISRMRGARFYRTERKTIFRRGAMRGIGPRGNMPCGNAAKGCRRRNPARS